MDDAQSNAETRLAALEAHLGQTMAELQRVTAALAAKAPSPVRPPKPDKYNGDRKDNGATNWLHQMELFLQLSGLLSGDYAVPCAVSYLSGTALTWWRGLEAQGNAPTTWAAFKAKLAASFSLVDGERIARTRLDSLRQRTSVTDYTDSFMRLLLELPNMHVEDAIHRFLQGLKPAVRLHVELQRPTTLDVAISLAQAADSALFSSRTFPGQRIRSSHFSAMPPASSQPMELGALKGLTPEERSQLLREGKCFRCRAPGHLARDCSLRSRAEARLVDQGNE